MRDAEKAAADEKYTKHMKELQSRSEEDSKLGQKKQELDRVAGWVIDRRVELEEKMQVQQEKKRKLAKDLELEETKRIKAMQDRIAEEAARKQAEAREAENDKWVTEQANAQRVANDAKAKKAADEYARKKNDEDFYGLHGQLADAKRKGEENYKGCAGPKKQPKTAESAAVSHAASASSTSKRSGDPPPKGPPPVKASDPPKMPPVKASAPWPLAYSPGPYTPYVPPAAADLPRLAPVYQVPTIFQPVPQDAPVQDNGDGDNSGWQAQPFQGTEKLHFHSSTGKGNSASSTPMENQTPPPPPLLVPITSGWPVIKGLPLRDDPRMWIADWTYTKRCT
jgi:hypothetical protein